jgi:molybdenum cofactor cytidylyltransferase
MNKTVAALLLAAGKSRRMGRCKQLLPLGNSTVIGRCIDTLQRGGIEKIVVVAAQDGHEVSAAAQAYPVRIVINREPDGDMASSVRAGRDFLTSGFSGILVALCDYPLVNPATIISIVESHSHYPDHIIVPRQQGRRGHPLLFPRVLLEELHTGMTLRDVVRRHSTRVHVVDVDDPGIVIDMDTPEDYERVCSLQSFMVPHDFTHTTKFS